MRQGPPLFVGSMTPSERESRSEERAHRCLNPWSGPSRSAACRDRRAHGGASWAKRLWIARIVGRSETVLMGLIELMEQDDKPTSLREARGLVLQVSLDPVWSEAPHRVLAVDVLHIGLRARAAQISSAESTRRP